MDSPVSRSSRIGVALKLALLAALLVSASYAGKWLMGQFDPHLTPASEPMLHRMIMTALAVYILLMMLPFVPGVEIGLGLMVMFGAKIVPLVYLGTVVALTLAFLIGRLVPQRSIAEIFGVLRLNRTRDMLHRLEPLDSSQRLEFLLQSASTRVTPFLLRNRFLALAAALNIPGNALIGGGGGICLVAGFSRLFTLPKFALTIVLAVSPVPLAILLTSA
jgi:hypothetical protein